MFAKVLVWNGDEMDRWRKHMELGWAAKLVALALLLAAIVVAIPKSALAEAATPFEVTLATDKAEYNEGDTAFITVTVKNAGSDTASASAYHITLPDSLKEKDGQALADELGDIAPGEIKTVTVEAVVLAPADGETENTVTPVSYGTDSKTVMPETGDPVQGTAFVVMASGALALLGALVIIAMKMRRAAGLFSIVLVLGLSFGISCFVVTPAMAKEVEAASASFEFTVNGKTEYVSASVTCSLPENPGDSDGVVYRNDVIVIKGYEENGGTYSFSDAQNTSGREVQIGDKIVLEIADDEIEGLMGTVTSVAKDGDVTVVQISQANDLTFAVEDIDIDETVSNIPVDQIKLAEGVEFDNSESASRSVLKQAGPASSSFNNSKVTSKDGGKYDLGKLNLKIDSKKMGKYGEGSIKLSYMPYARYVFKWNWRRGVTNLQAGLGGTATLSGSLAIKNEVDIPMGYFPIPIKPAGTLWINLYITPSVSGDITFSNSVDAYLGIKYNGKRIEPDCQSLSVDSDIKLQGKAKLQITPDLSFNVFSVEMADLKFSFGDQFSPGKISVRDTGLICSPINVCLVADLSVGSRTPWMKNLGLSWDKEIWNEKNSPVKTELHYENGKRVKKCTYVKPEEKPDPDETDPDPDDDEEDNKTEDGYLVEPEDEGLGNEIKWLESPLVGILGVEYLAEPFYLYAGQSLTVSAEYGGTITYCGTEDTLIRESGAYENGKIFGGVEFCGSITGWSEDPGSATLEVLSGRVEVTGIGGDLRDGARPLVTKGECGTVPYPLRISRSDLILRSGQTYQMTQENDVDALRHSGADLDVPDAPTWTSKNWEIADVDAETGTITANRPGETNIVCRMGGFQRYCKVKVI